ncbi:unnamed protein product, partial [Candidula unifasciata]
QQGLLIAQPNEFEAKHRPPVIQHLPPLSAPQPAFSDAPKIIEHGSFTKAVPTREKKYVRRVSDSIGNNYSPRARNFTTAQIYESTKLAYTVEETYFLSPRKSVGSHCQTTSACSLPPLDSTRRLNTASSIPLSGSRYHTNHDHEDVQAGSWISEPSQQLFPPINGHSTDSQK